MPPALREAADHLMMEYRVWLSLIRKKTQTSNLKYRTALLYEIPLMIFSRVFSSAGYSPFFCNIAQNFNKENAQTDKEKPLSPLWLL